MSWLWQKDYWDNLGNVTTLGDFFGGLFGQDTRLTKLDKQNASNFNIGSVDMNPSSMGFINSGAQSVEDYLRYNKNSQDASSLASYGVPLVKLAASGGTDPMAWVQLGYNAIKDVANFFNQKEQQSYERNMQQKIFEREDTAVQRRIADLKAAGLSPTLAAGGSANSGATVSSSAPQFNNEMNILSTLQTSQAIKNMQLQNAMMYYQIRNMQEQNNLLRIRSRSYALDVDKKQLDIDNYYYNMALNTYRYIR